MDFKKVGVTVSGLAAVLAVAAVALADGGESAPTCGCTAPASATCTGVEISQTNTCNVGESCGCSVTRQGGQPGGCILTVTVVCFRNDK